MGPPICLLFVTGSWFGAVSGPASGEWVRGEGGLHSFLGKVGAEMRLSRVNLVPVGQPDRDVMAAVRDALRERFLFSVSINEGVDIPCAEAYDAGRRQYLSSYLVHALDSLDGIPADRVIGITDLDLYVPELNFVFGEAAFYGRAAVVSLARLDPAFYGRGGNRDLLVTRALKEVIHELGHTLGLGHCPRRECVMCFSNSLADVDGKSPEFCPGCLSRLAGLTRRRKGGD